MYKNPIVSWSNEKLYNELHSSRNKRFNPGLIILVQQEINKRWLETWAKQKQEEKNV